MRSPNFTAHNIRLADGSLTKPESLEMTLHPWFRSTKRVIDLVLGDDKSGKKIVDFGCLEGGYSVEFARLGLDVIGIEANDLNFEACQWVASKVQLENLNFLHMNVMDVEKLDQFDIGFICGLLYHLDKPISFLEKVAPLTRRCLIIQTHFSLAGTTGDFDLSEIQKNEGVNGRWFVEFAPSATVEERASFRWAAFDNSKSFWIRREELLEKLLELGFDLVFEQFDGFGENLAAQLDSGYEHYLRGTFVAVKSRP